jgi:hypothetical protein
MDETLYAWNDAHLVGVIYVYAWNDAHYAWIDTLYAVNVIIWHY